MPNKAALVFAIAALVAATAFAIHVLRPSSPGATSASSTTDTATLATLRDLSQRLDQLEREVFQPRLAPSDPAARLADLEARLHELEGRSTPRAASSPPAASSSTPDKTPQPAVDASSLPDEELRIFARSLSGRQAYEAAAPYWRELLSRRPSDELFVEAKIQLGYAHRGAKDHDKAEASFREAMRVAGEDSEKGQWANYQIGWSQRFRGDNQVARDTMASVASSAATTRQTRGHAQIYVARFSLDLNDVDRAREALQSVLRDHGGSKAPSDVFLVNHANELLETLK